MIPRLAPLLLLALAPSVAWAQSPGQKTAWRFGQPGGDASRRVSAIVEASGRYNVNPPLLSVRCAGGETMAAIHWPQDLGTGSTLAVKWRTNDSPVKTEDWVLRSTTSSVSHPTPVPFLTSLFGKTELIVSVTSYNGAEATATIPIAGVEAAVTPVIDACKREPAPGTRRVGDGQPPDQGRTRWGLSTNTADGVVAAGVEALERFDHVRVGGSLVVRCVRGRTEAVVGWPRRVHLGTGPTMAVKWRTNDSTGKTEPWILQGRFVSHLTPIPFVKSLFGKTELIVSLTPAGEPEQSLTFPIAGVEAAMKSISDACTWDAAPRPAPRAGTPG